MCCVSSPRAVKEMLLSSSLNILMLCVPLGIAAQLCAWGAVPVFLLVSAWVYVGSRVGAPERHNSCEGVSLGSVTVIISL